MALSTDTDILHLRRAIEIAEQGRGRSPNPLVGAVIVRDGRAAGEGYHAAYGQAHAERDALAACAEDPRGATLYVSLEPCAHHGRTPPCTDAISRPASRALWSPPTTRPRRRPAAAWGSCATRAIQVVVADGEVAEARADAQPAVPQARAHRPPAGAVQVRDDARRQGRHAHGRLEVDLGRGSRAARTAGAPSATPSPSGSAPRWPTIRS